MEVIKNELLEELTIRIGKDSSGIVLELTQPEVEEIVKYWYLNGMMPDIFQNEDGEDLEEVLLNSDELLIKRISQRELKERNDVSNLKFNKGPLRSKFINEMGYYQHLFETTGHCTVGMGRILNDKEVEFVELIGFRHDTVWGPLLIPVDGDDWGLISVVSNHFD